MRQWFQVCLTLEKVDTRVRGRFFDPLKMADVIIMNGIKTL